MMSAERRVAMSMMFSAAKIWPLESWRNFRSTAMCSLKRVGWSKPDTGLKDAGGFLRRHIGHFHRMA
eukprot:3672164-Heterocapsa_arctica.AAC.1